MRDWLAIVATLALLAAIFIGLPAAYFFAPCDKLDWIATKNVPARCLPGGRG